MYAVELTSSSGDASAHGVPGRTHTASSAAAPSPTPKPSTVTLTGTPATASTTAGPVTACTASVDGRRIGGHVPPAAA